MVMYVVYYTRVLAGERRGCERRLKSRLSSTRQGHLGEGLHVSHEGHFIPISMMMTYGLCAAWTHRAAQKGIFPHLGGH